MQLFIDFVLTNWKNGVAICQDEEDFKTSRREIISLILDMLSQQSKWRYCPDKVYMSLQFRAEVWAGDKKISVMGMKILFNTLRTDEDNLGRECGWRSHPEILLQGPVMLTGEEGERQLELAKELRSVPGGRRGNKSEWYS